jgi:hypothetical protein
MMLAISWTVSSLSALGMLTMLLWLLASVRAWHWQCAIGCVAGTVWVMHESKVISGVKHDVLMAAVIEVLGLNHVVVPVFLLLLLDRSAASRNHRDNDERYYCDEIDNAPLGHCLTVSSISLVVAPAMLTHGRLLRLNTLGSDSVQLPQWTHLSAYHSTTMSPLL